MSDENKWMVRHIYEAMCNQQSLEFVADHFASDFLGHSTAEYRGPEGQLKRFNTLVDALQDGVFTIQDQIAEGDKVVIRWIARGTQIAEFEGLRPTGEMVMITGIDILRIAHGKIIEGWSNANRQGVTVA